MDKKETKKSKIGTKKKRNWNNIIMLCLLVLLLLEFILIPFLIYAEVKRILPIVAFLILPTVFGIVILCLSRMCTIDYKKRKENMIL